MLSQFTVEASRVYFTLVNDLGESEQPFVIGVLSPLSIDMFDWSTPEAKTLIQCGISVDYYNDQLQVFPHFFLSFPPFLPMYAILEPITNGAMLLRRLSPP